MRRMRSTGSTGLSWAESVCVSIGTLAFVRSDRSVAVVRLRVAPEALHAAVVRLRAVVAARLLVVVVVVVAVRLLVDVVAAVRLLVVAATAAVAAARLLVVATAARLLGRMNF